MEDSSAHVVIFGTMIVLIVGACSACGISLGGEGDVGGVDDDSVALPKRRQTASSSSSSASSEPGDDDASPVTNSPAANKAVGCKAQAVSWNVDADQCSATLSAAMTEGETRVLTDSTLSATGSVEARCNQGVLSTTKAVCEPPRVIDVAGQAGCVNGHCMAAVGGQCGVPDPVKATAICVAKGFQAHTALSTAPGPKGEPQCAADGSGCFVNANPTCNIVFATVTCRH